jgi:protein involved in polysaccharide export with SLBB domain
MWPVTRRRFLSACLALLLAALGWAGGASTDSHAQEAAYRLGANDKLRIIVFGEPDLSGEFEIDGRGNVSYPLIGQIAVGGLTIPQTETKLTELLSKDYLQQPKVSVEILNYRPFYILGEVNVPGRYGFVNGMTVLNAVAMGGGFSYRADRGDIRIRRESARGPQKLKATVETPVLPGDVIEVGDRLF